MINFVTVNAQNYLGQGKKYVEILHDSIIRNLASGTEGRFICFTDDEESYNSGIEKRPLHGDLRGWWNKIYLFKGDLFAEGDTIVFFDLDTVIVSGLDEIIKYQGDFAILRDFYRPNGMQSSVMIWQAGKNSVIWDAFEANGFPNVEGGDQAWIGQFFKSELFKGCNLKADILQELYPDCFVSYKVSCQAGIPKNAKVVVFHGNPRPHVAGGWVDKVWKIGGGGSLEMDMICNVSAEQLEKNIRYCLTLGLPEIDRMGPLSDVNAVFVGGGPSIENHKLMLAEMKRKSKIFALNGSYRWLRNNGILADYHIIADARPENANFIDVSEFPTYLIASHCDKTVFDKLVCKHVLVWHRGHEGMQDIVNPNRDKYDAYMSGGSTVGLVGMSVAYAMGFRKFHLFGYDSSYVDGQGHAYPQSLNDNDRILDIDVGSRSFKSAPWMVQQVNEYVEFAPILVEMGCEITTYGDGMLQYINRCMVENALPETEIVEKNGFYWPAIDIECRQSIEHFLDDADWIMGHCKAFDVVIQAGGNVGMWPKKMAEKFKSVYTFEPDNINFQCLVRNCHESNIVKLQAGLGDVHAMVKLQTSRSNCGAHCVDGGGILPILRIDDLALEACDLIQLDIEGFEGLALKGAVNTIHKFRPVICLELKGLGDKYGMTDQQTKEWLKALGYKITSRKHRDVVFTYNGRD